MRVETMFLDLPAGQAVRADVAWDDGWNQSSYYYYYYNNLGARWFRLDCATREDLPEDRWLAIAETFEFLASPSSATPHLPPQRVERPEAGFAVTLPWQWQHVDAADADPDIWWDAKIDGGPAAYHEEQRASGLLLMA